MTSEMIVSAEELAAAVPDGARLAIPKDSSGVSMAATREIVRRGVHRLHLVCVPTSGLQADILIGVGAVATIETSAVTLDEYGVAPRFTAAVRAGALRVVDSTCPAVYAALQAGEKGIPFIPLRWLIGSYVLRNRADWKVIDNPFDSADPIALLPAIRPDVALFHTPLADCYGNVFVGRNRDLVTMAHAAKQTLVTVEEITDRNLIDDAQRSGAVLPSIYVTQLACAKNGAWPLALWDIYADDEAVLARYAASARSAEGFAKFLDEWLTSQPVAA